MIQSTTFLCLMVANSNKMIMCVINVGYKCVCLFEQKIAMNRITE